MHRRTARLNRVVLVLLGVVLLTAGGFLLARRFGRIDGLATDDRLYSRPEARWLHEHAWVWFVVAGVAAVVALLALRWLLVQARVDRVRSLAPDPDPDQAGRTSMAADVLTDAVEDDLSSYPGVDRARVLLIGTADAPELVVRVSAHPAADLADVRRRIVTEALPAARTALDAETIPAQVHLVVAGRRGSTAQRVVR